MGDFQQLLQSALSAIYYVVIAVVTLFSLFGVYILTNYGRSRSISMAVSLAYITVFIILLATSYGTLRSVFIQ